MLSEQVQPVDEAIQALITSYNNEANEHDDLIEQLETLQAENEQMFDALKRYEKDAGTVLEQIEKSKQLLAQANRERDQALNRAKDLDIQIKAFKEIAATPKKVRDKIKGYQERLDTQKKATEQQKQNLNAEKKKVNSLNIKVEELLNRLDAAGINQVYRKGNDIIQTYPYHLGNMVEGYDHKMTPLLYLHQCGRGGLILLNDDGEAELVSAPKGGVRPKSETLEHCGQWLRRMKAKNWEVERVDLESLSHGSE